MTVNSIPQPSQPIAGGQRIDPTWYRWLRELDREARDTGADLSAEIEAIARKLGSPDGTIDGIPASSGAVSGLFPISVTDGRVSLATIPSEVGGELFGLTTDQWGRITAIRPVVAGAGITIDGTTDPDQIEISTNALTNPMTTAGDLIRGGVAGAPERLAIGTDTQVLTVVSGAPAWAAAPGGLSNPMTTAEDLIKGGASGVPARLAVGTNGQVLTVTGGAVGWATPSGLTNPMTTSGDIITGGASGVPQRLAAGADGNVLTISAGVPAWAAPSGGGGAPDPGVQTWGYIIANVAGSGFVNIGGLAVVATGSASARTPSGADLVSSLPRSAVTAAASATAVCGHRTNAAAIFCLGGSAGIGGFNIKHRVIVGNGAPTASHRFFSGLSSSFAAPTDVNPSTLTNAIGIGYDSGDTQLQIIHNDGSGTATKVALGASFPKPSVALANVYDFEFSTVGGSGVVDYIVVDTVSGATASGTLTTDLPAAATMLTLWEYMSAGGTSTAVSLEACFWYYRLGKARP